MNDQMVLDKMSQIIRVGFVTARQPEKMRVQVRLPDTVDKELITDWLPVLCPRACADLHYDLPDIGDQVLCLFLPNGLERGFVIGAMYGRQTPPVQSGDKTHRKFSDGATIEYDRAIHALKADIPGTAEIKCSQSITLEAPIIYVRGTLTQTAQDGSPGKSVFSGGMEVKDGGVNVVGGDVKASGVSLASHTTDGVQSGAGKSSHPSGGMPESPGVLPKVPAAMSATASALQIAATLDALADEVDAGDISVDKNILCIPDIVDGIGIQAEIDNDEDLKKGCELLAKFYRKWLAGNANADATSNPDVEFIEWDWIKKFPRVVDALEDLKSRLINEKAQKELNRKISARGGFGNIKKEFKFITDDWRDWKENSYQRAPVSYPWLGMHNDGLFFALGGFNLYAIADGYTEPIPDGRYLVTITKIAVFSYDQFDFTESEENLGCWDCEANEFNGLDCSKGFNLNNYDFRQFRSRHGHGGDFRIFSNLHVLDNFEALSYVTKP